MRRIRAYFTTTVSHLLVYKLLQTLFSLFNEIIIKYTYSDIHTPRVYIYRILCQTGGDIPQGVGVVGRCAPWVHLQLYCMHHKRS